MLVKLDSSDSQRSSGSAVMVVCVRLMESLVFMSVFGETEAYYGTVEQQGRLTLHLHTLLLIKNALSPSDI